MLAQYLCGVARLLLTTKPAVPLWWFGVVLIRAFMNNPRAAVLPLLWLACAPAAQAAPGDVTVETVVVTAGALPGTALDPDKVPFNTQIINSADLNRFGAASTLDSLDLRVTGVSISNAQNSPFQPNLFYRGFEASPLAGDAQGLAVYANGVRLNQSFGDTLNWDLIPDVAIDRLTLEGSNPVFGLNALGGALVVQMKNGFTYAGAEGEALFGVFGRRQGSIQYGVQDGSKAFYIAVNRLTETGWRQHSPSNLTQIFTDLGWRGDAGEIHLNLSGADNDLTGNGTSPVELLAVARSAVFTFPDNTKNTNGLANLYGILRASDALSFQANLYLSGLRQRSMNGDASSASPCAASAGLLCLDDGSIATGENGNAIGDFLSGGPYGQLNVTRTDSTAFGGALQTAYDAPLFGRSNHFLAGFAVDEGHTGFAAHSEVGGISAERGFVGPGVTIDQADGSIAPVKVTTQNSYYGFYLSDLFDLTDSFSLSASARYNIANTASEDALGTALNGSHHYARLNPAIGASYEISSSLSAYLGYSQANRAPTPAELSCADSASPCSLTNFFVGDPTLKQVTAHTMEAGLRGQLAQVFGGDLRWHAGLYRADTQDDIQFVASDIVGRAFFQNIGKTRRQGVESSLDFQRGALSVSLDYSHTDATFRSVLTLNSPLNPLADSNGQIHVMPGMRLPSVPTDVFKATIGYELLPGWNVAFAAHASSGVYLRGDESNLNPKTRPYAVFDLSSSYRVTERVELFATLRNLFDKKYETFGTFSPTSDVPIPEVPGASNPRSLSPAPPFSVFAGGRLFL
ncbi:MAG TPA: TonB-dependent receptor [Micropepsaceae bacterium]|nr:TonB-dependent receptor [Micropepsaceae bacterium]